MICAQVVTVTEYRTNAENYITVQLRLILVFVYVPYVGIKVSTENTSSIFSTLHQNMGNHLPHYITQQNKPEVPRAVA
jgi:hypothetical protein